MIFCPQAYLFWTLLLRKNFWLVLSTTLVRTLANSWHTRDSCSICGPKRDSCFDFGPTRDSCFNFGPQGAFVPSLVPQGTLVSNLARSVLGVRCPHPYHIFVIFSTLSPFYGLEIVRQEYVNLHQSSLVTKTLYNFMRNFFKILWMNFTHSNPLRIYLVKLYTCSLPTS